MPLPNTRLIHSLFEPHHRPVANGQLTAECRIYDTTMNAIYEGACRVQRLGEGNLMPIVADLTITGAAYMVAVPSTSGIREGHIVEVTARTGDPDLIGQQLVVRAAQRGSITWQQTLICDMHQQPAL